MNDPLLFTPGPVGVPFRVIRASIRPMIFHRSEDFHRLFSQVLDKLHRVLSTNEDIIVITSSGTGAVEASVASIIRKGDTVIVPVYGTFSERLYETAVMYGAKVISKRYSGKEGPTPQDIEELLEKDKNIKAVYLVLNDTSPGILLKNFEKIANVVKEKGVLLIVDAVSILGGHDIPIDKWGIDILVSATQKCLATPPGLSIITVSNEAWRVINNMEPRSFYFNLKRYKRYLEKMETPFTPAVSILYALNEALEMILEFGVEEWIKMHELRADILYRALSEFGFKPYVKEDFRSHTIITVSHTRIQDHSTLISSLKKEYNILIAGGIGKYKGNFIRIGNMGCISKRDLVTLISCIATELIKRGIKVDLTNTICKILEDLKCIKTPEVN